jgi:hypothetical protein
VQQTGRLIHYTSLVTGISVPDRIARFVRTLFHAVIGFSSFFLSSRFLFHPQIPVCYPATTFHHLPPLFPTIA